MKKQSRLRKALLFAIEAHSGVVRKFAGEPYVYHPIAVAYILKRHKTSKNIIDLLIASLLHDVVEDVEWVTVDLIRELFGELVASLVDELTNDPIELQKMGKELYMVEKVKTLSSYALCIKLSDRLHNCSDLSANEKFRIKYVKQTRSFLNALNGRYLSAPHKSLIKKIDDSISVYE